MLKFIFIIGIIFLSGCSAKPFPELYRYEDNGLYGFKDRSGNVVIPAKFDFTERSFLASIVPAKKDGLFGYIDETGKWKIAPIFENAGPFSKAGYAGVKYKGKIGYIGKTGNWLIKPLFDHGTIRTPFEYHDFIAVSLNGKWGMVSKRGYWKVKPKFDFLETGKYGNLIATKYEGKWGFIDLRGYWRIDPIYKNVFPYSENGLAAVQSFENRKWGIVDTRGNYIFLPVFDTDGTYWSSNGTTLHFQGVYGQITLDGYFTSMDGTLKGKITREGKFTPDEE